MKKRLRKKWRFLQCAHWKECIGFTYSDCIVCKHLLVSQKQKRDYHNSRKELKKYFHKIIENIEWEEV